MHIKTFMQLLLFLFIMTADAPSQEIRISVENTSGYGRSGEPVVIQWDRLSENLSGVGLEKLRLIDENSRSLAFQIDDLDGNGSPDEFVFTADFGPAQTREFVLTANADDAALPCGPFRTDALNYKRIDGEAVFLDDDDGPGTFRNDNLYPFDGIGWESEIVGYRIYLDERNAIDIQGKREKGLHWKYIAESGVDYQLDAYWGMDILHVGPALGFGGIGFREGDSIVNPHKLERRRTRVISRGPVRAVARIDYHGWELADEKADLTSIFMIYAGDRVTEHRVILQSAGESKIIATGIVKHQEGEAFTDPERTTLYTAGPQSRTGEELMMSLTFNPSNVIEMNEDEYNHLVLLELKIGEPVVYLMSSYWEGEPGEKWCDEKTREFIKSLSRRLNEPLVIDL